MPSARRMEPSSHCPGSTTKNIMWCVNHISYNYGEAIFPQTKTFSIYLPKHLSPILLAVHFGKQSSSGLYVVHSDIELSEPLQVMFATKL